MVAVHMDCAIHQLAQLHKYCPVHMQSIIIPLDMELPGMDVWTVKPKNFIDYM